MSGRFLASLGMTNGTPNAHLKFGTHPRGHVVLTADPIDKTTLERVGASTAASLVAISAKDDFNLEICRVAQEDFGIPHRVALVTAPGVREMLVAEGTRVVQSQMATVLALEGALHFPAAFDMLADQADGVEVREGSLRNPRLHGQTLRRIKLPGNVLLLGLRREGEVLVPNGDTVLREDDVLMLLGHPDEIQEALACIDFEQFGRGPAANLPDHCGA
jgi:Trk K+ transport system NAD-binding subunit